MKPLTLHLPDEVYERAEQRAAGRGVALPFEAAELLKRYGEDDQADSTTGPADHVSHEQPSRGDVAELLRELANVADECRSANWDGQGAALVSSETFGVARRFVTALPPGYPLPTAGVEADGHLTLEWYRDPTWTLSVSVGPQADLFYAGLFGTNDVRGREAFSGEIPPIILGLIQRVFTA